VRLRYHITKVTSVITRRVRGGKVSESPLLAEDCQLLAFTGSPQNAEWLGAKIAEELLLAEPEANIQPDQATHFLRQMLDGFDAIIPHLNEMAQKRGEELLDAHRRVRIAARETNVSHRVEPQLPCDVLGVYLYLPKV
jgi:hypothetical protein